MLAGDGPPNVLSVTRLDANPTSADVVDYLVTFDEAVTGVDNSDFALETQGLLSGASIVQTIGTADSYVVTVNTGDGSGTIRLDVYDNNSIRDSDGDRLGGNGPRNGDFTTGEEYLVDRDSPIILALRRLDSSPTSADEVSYAFELSEDVVGVDTTDFELTADGPVGAGIVSVSAEGATYQIVIQTGQGDGQILLEFVDDGSISDLAGNSLVGADASGKFTGETYIVDRPPALEAISRFSPGEAITNAPTVTFELMFSEDVFSVDASDFELVIDPSLDAAISNVYGSGRQWFVDIATGTSDGTIGLHVLTGGIIDATGNLLEEHSIVSPLFDVDRVQPEVLSIEKFDPSYNGYYPRFVVTFSEAIETPATTDFFPSVTGFDEAYVSYIEEVSPSVYEVQVTTVEGEGTVRLGVHDTIFDQAGNGLSESVLGDQYYDLDTLRPNLISIVRLDASPTSQSTLRFGVTFSEDVVGVEPSRFYLSAHPSPLRFWLLRAPVRIM